jgi:hypothetical protein
VNDPAKIAVFVARTPVPARAEVVFQGTGKTTAYGNTAYRHEDRGISYGEQSEGGGCEPESELMVDSGASLERLKGDEGNSGTAVR